MIVLHEQVAALDQLHAHLLGQEGMLEVGGVVHAGREHHHRGVGNVLRRDAAQHVEQQVGIVRDRRHAIAREQVREQPHHHLAVLQHVGHAGGHAQVVFQHVELALARAHHVDACHVGIDIAGHVDAEHLGAVLRVVIDLVGWDHTGADDVLPVVDIVDEAVQRRHPLAQAALERCPLAGGEDAGNDVERDGPLGAAVGLVFFTVNGERDAHAPEDQISLGALVVHGAFGLARQPIRELLVMPPHGTCRQGLASVDCCSHAILPIEHLVEKPRRHDGRSPMI